jgi:hypothetical protein
MPAGSAPGGWNVGRGRAGDDVVVLQQRRRASTRRTVEPGGRGRGAARHSCAARFRRRRRRISRTQSLRHPRAATPDSRFLRDGGSGHSRARVGSGLRLGGGRTPISDRRRPRRRLPGRHEADVLVVHPWPQHGHGDRDRRARPGLRRTSPVPGLPVALACGTCERGLVRSGRRRNERRRAAPGGPTSPHTHS